MRGSFTVVLLCFIAVLHFRLACAQSLDEGRVLQDLIESVADQLPDNVDVTMLLDQMQSVQKNPIRLNNATVSDLNTLYFLNALQTQQIVEYIRQYGPLVDVAELQTLPSMDVESLRLLEHLVLLEPENVDYSLKKIVSLSSHSVLSRYVDDFQENNDFLGNKGRFYFRYQMNSTSLLQANITLDKDAGEYFWSDKYPNKIDFASMNMVLKPQKQFRQLVIGDYHLQFGQGLVLWTGFAVGMGPDITTVVRKPMGLKPYNSATEFNFMRGLAADFSLWRKQINLTVFYNRQRIDAAFNGVGEVSSVLQTGYHRTPAEIERKANLFIQGIGSVLSYQYKQLQLGAVFQMLDFDRPFEPYTAWFQREMPRYQYQRNASLFYQYVYRNAYLYGETAVQNTEQWATINGVLLSMSKRASLSLSYRKYALAYQAFNANALSQNTRVQNESGWYAGLDIKPSRKWKLQFYTDWYTFPWLRFRVSAPSSGYQMLLQTVYEWRKKHQFLLRYRYRSKIENQTAQSEDRFARLRLLDYQNVRIQANWWFGRSWQFENRIDWMHFSALGSTSQNGFLWYQDASFEMSKRLKLGARLAYFDTQGYDSRVYAYENNVLYAFGFNVFQGKGLRSYINLHTRWAKGLDAWLRYAFTKYQNQTSAWRNEMTVQLNYQF